MKIRYFFYCKIFFVAMITLWGSRFAFAGLAEGSHEMSKTVSVDKKEVTPSAPQKETKKINKDSATHIVVKHDNVTEVVTKITKKIISIIDSEKELRNKNSELFHQQIDNVFSATVAFDAVVRGVMGKYSHRVSSKKFDEFVPVFKKDLLRFYSKMLCDYKTGDMKIIHIVSPEQDQIDKHEKGELLSVPVEIKISSGKQSYLLTYSMMKVADTWKIRNITVDGINIGIQFRNQFAEAVKVHGSVEKVIDNWNKFMQHKPVAALKNSS